jgi:thiamine-monophosphate kinase
VTRIPLGPGREFDLIRAIASRLGTVAPALGDDAAVIPIGGTNLVATIDCSIEGVHFRTDWMSDREIGWRAAAAAISDLAAEGAGLTGVLVSLGLPGGDGESAAGVEIMAGIGDVVEEMKGTILGGDIVKSDRVIIDVCALGTTDHPVSRAGARPGDGIWITGELGGPGAALAAWSNGGQPGGRERMRFVHPVPRIAAGAWLARNGAQAMIDISDGLVADLGHIAAASGVAVVLDADALPLLCGKALDALSSGEEYELAVALPPGFGAREADGLFRDHSVMLTRVGECLAGSGVQVTRGGRPIDAPAGFDHFTS